MMSTDIVGSANALLSRDVVAMHGLLKKQRQYCGGGRG